MLDITKCYSILIASGNGGRCNDLRDLLRKELFTIDESTGKHKVVIMKHGRRSMPDDYNRVSKQIATVMSPLFMDVEDHYFSVDLPQKRTNR
jgi:hypothetical protein